MQKRGNVHEINNYTPEYLHSVAENHRMMIEKMSGKMQIFNDNFDACYNFLTGLLENSIEAIRNMPTSACASCVSTPSVHSLAMSGSAI